MGAKMLKKQLEKEQKRAEERQIRTKKTGQSNQGEFLNREKQTFDITSSTLAVDEMFIESSEETSNRKFQDAYDDLIKREHFFLTEDDTLLEEDDEEDSEDEQLQIHEMIHRANTETKTLFHGVESSVGNNSAREMSFIDDQMSDRPTDRDNLVTHDALVEKDEDEDELDDGKEDKDIKKLKQTIANRLEIQQKMITPRRFIIKSSTSEFLNYFEYLVMIMAIWNAIWTPLTIAFDVAKDMGESPMIIAIDYVVDTVFTADIVLGFMKSYVNAASGDEIYDPKMIAKHYLTGSFLIDFVSTFPFTQIGESAGIHYQSLYYLFADVMSLLKAARLAKILKKIRDMPISIEDKAMMQVMFYAFLIFVYTHIIGCIMWLSLKTDEHWIPAVDFGAVTIKSHMVTRWNDDGDTIELTESYVLMYKWFTAWYNSAISFALVEVNARTSGQITMMFCIYVVNAMINAYLIGVFIEQFSVKNAKKVEKQEQLDDSNSTMITLRIIPVPLKNQVRTFFLQSFQMKSLQDEFEEIDGNLKVSLSQRMKFEICERVVSDSRGFLYLRLYMIQQYQKKRAFLLEKKPESPTLTKLTPLNVSNQYKKIVFELINDLHIEHHSPGEKVVEQNQTVINSAGQIKADVKFHLILTGNYKVVSLNFIKTRKQDDDPAVSAIMPQGGLGQKPPQTKGEKNLKAGDFFGEISLLFGCRRTATVKAKQYCECACIKKQEFLQLIANHNIFKQYLTMNIMKEYDDELRLFLVNCLKKIDYLSEIGEDILTHLSMHMISQQADKDSDLYTASNIFKKTESIEMAIIFSGRLAITTNLENANNDVVIEYIEKGAILNAHNCLTEREHFATVKCLTAVTYYYLPVQIMAQLCTAYPKMRVAFHAAQM